MEQIIDLLKTNLPPNEFKGYIKGTVIEQLMHSGNDSTKITVAKCYLDKLVELNTGSIPEGNKEVVKPDEPDEPAPAENNVSNSPANVRSNIDVKKVRDLYINKNLSLDACSKALGTSKSTLGRVLKENNIKKYKDIPAPPKDKLKETVTAADNETEIYTNAAREILES